MTQSSWTHSRSGIMHTFTANIGKVVPGTCLLQAGPRSPVHPETRYGMSLATYLLLSPYHQVCLQLIHWQPRAYQQVAIPLVDAFHLPDNLFPSTTYSTNAQHSRKYRGSAATISISAFKYRPAPALAGSNRAVRLQPPIRDRYCCIHVQCTPYK